jgi:hypothetical protein
MHAGAGNNRRPQQKARPKTAPPKPVGVQTPQPSTSRTPILSKSCLDGSFVLMLTFPIPVVHPIACLIEANKCKVILLFHIHFLLHFIAKFFKHIFNSRFNVEEKINKQHQYLMGK